MTRFQRATQIWSVLALAARNHQILTYGLLGKLTGLPPTLGGFLEPIQSYCLLHGFKPLTALVVNAHSGLPGEGYIATPAAEVPQVQQEVFAFDWIQHGCPKPEEFEEAASKLPSNGLSGAVTSSADFEPVAIRGEALSATVLRERR